MEVDKKVKCGNSCIPKLGMLDLRNIVNVDGSQQPILEGGDGILVFAEAVGLLLEMYFDLGDDRTSGANRVDLVDGQGSREDERNAAVAHRLILGVYHHDDEVANISVPSI